MVGRDQHAGAGGGQIFQAADLDAKQRAEQQRAEIAHAFLAPGRQHEPDHAEARDREPEEYPGHGQTSGLQQRHEQRADDHEGGLQHIAGGDDTRPLGRRAPGLNGGKRRDHEQTAAEGKDEEVGQHAKTAGRGRERHRRDIAAVRRMSDRPGQIQSHKSHDDAAQRHQREIGASVTEMCCEQ
jgi:hypothetical protein